MYRSTEAAGCSFGGVASLSPQGRWPSAAAAPGWTTTQSANVAAAMERQGVMLIGQQYEGITREQWADLLAADGGGGD